MEVAGFSVFLLVLSSFSVENGVDKLEVTELQRCAYRGNIDFERGFGNF